MEGIDQGIVDPDQKIAWEVHALSAMSELTANMDQHDPKRDRNTAPVLQDEVHSTVIESCVVIRTTAETDLLQIVPWFDAGNTTRCQVFHLQTQRRKIHARIQRLGHQTCRLQFITRIIARQTGELFAQTCEHASAPWFSKNEFPASVPQPASGLPATGRGRSDSRHRQRPVVHAACW